MDKYAIFLDFDGTLSSGDNKVSMENIDAVKLAQKAGHYVFISTGRNRPGIEDIASRIHNFDGYISGLGSHISLDGEVIFGKYFDADAVLNALKVIAGEGYDIVIGCTEKAFVLNPNELQKKVFCETNLEEFSRICRDYHIQKIESRNIAWKKEQLELLKSFATVYVHDSYTECCPIGCSKAGAIEVVAKRLRIKPENTVAMGDSANDLDMLSAAAIAVVMGNAPDFVKEEADFVSKACGEHGVAYAIDKLILNR